MRENFETVYLDNSKISGIGVFAKRAFKKGDQVLTIDDSRVVTDQNPLDPTKGESHTHCDWLPFGKTVFMQKPESHVNSSCDPNVYIRTFDSARHMIALRDITPHEEITVDYMPTIFGGEAWPCHCGSIDCRKENPGSFFDLPIEWQKKLLWQVDKGFLKEHQEKFDNLRRNL